MPGYLTLEEIDAVLSPRPQDLSRFCDWLPEVTPQYYWSWPHLRHIQSSLDQLTGREIERLAVFLPPRHGKSSLITVRYPIWRMLRDRQSKVIVGSHNQSLANKFSRETRRIARGCGYGIAGDHNTLASWGNFDGGSYRCCGVGNPPMGEGADLIVVDDPFKSRQEAWSLVYRDRVWDWFNTDLASRLEPGGQIVVVFTRWHYDDLWGRIGANLDLSRWKVISLPAIAMEGDELGRQPGAALCPARFDEEALEKIRKESPVDWMPLYQQNPMATEGGMFKRHWFRMIGPDQLPDGCTFVRYWDKAGTQDAGCYTAGVLMARDGGGRYYVVDVVRGQWEAHEREQVIRQTAEMDHQKHGYHKIYLEQEPGASGKESVQSSIRNLAGFSAYADLASGQKEVRAQPFAAMCGIGQVHLVRASWNREYISELCQFPAGAYKDQVDASSGAFNQLSPQLRVEDFAKSSSKPKSILDKVSTDGGRRKPRDFRHMKF